MSFFDDFEKALDKIVNTTKELGCVIAKSGNVWTFDPERMRLAEVDD